MLSVSVVLLHFNDLKYQFDGIYKIKVVFSAMKRTKVTNKSDMAELEHKSFQDRLEQKGKTPNFIRKSRARAYVCVREEKEKMRFSNEKIVSE